jgi:hypothetical protein
MSLAITANIILAAVSFAVVVGMLAWSILDQRPTRATGLAVIKTRRPDSRVRRPSGSPARQA